MGNVLEKNTNCCDSQPSFHASFCFTPFSLCCFFLFCSFPLSLVLFSYSLQSQNESHLFKWLYLPFFAVSVYVSMLELLVLFVTIIDEWPSFPLFCLFILSWQRFFRFRSSEFNSTIQYSAQTHPRFAHHHPTFNDVLLLATCCCFFFLCAAYAIYIELHWQTIHWPVW